MNEYSFDRIFISRDSHNEISDRICNNLSGIPVERVKERKEVNEYVHAAYEDPLREGKRVLFLSTNPGEKIKRCPCTQRKTGCGYYVVNLYTNCPIDCSYCILQGYLNNPFITIHTNLGEYIEEIAKAASLPGFFRVGTGELSDSLAIDHITGYSRILIDRFSSLLNVQLELKTKSVCIENLLSIKPGRNTVISWSLNPQCLIDTDERLSAPLKSRIKAARELQRHGYKLAFHFDPLVLIEDWKEEYSKVIEMLFDSISEKSIEWISMGALRFDHKLRSTILERFPESVLPLAEFIECRDKKLRYLRNERSSLFKHIVSLLRKRAPNTHIYLCMEDDSIRSSSGLA